MSVFNKMLASIGIGSAKVDTKVEKETYMPGEYIRGIVEVKGGAVEQQIEEIYLSLHTRYIKESDDKKYEKTAVIERIRLNEPFVIASNGTREIPFSFQLPLDAPLTYGRIKVWIATNLDIRNAIDPTDEDYLKVVPTPLIHSAFLALTELGFKLRNAECEEASYHLRKRVPFIQEFEFVPYSGAYRGKLDELEFTFFQSSADQAEVLLEIDRRARGFSGLFAEALDLDETKVRLMISEDDIPNMKSVLSNIISKYA
ncbi:MAG: sporulation protein [Bacillus sp. (in: firmicutes)]